jgi:hypothetical protein
MKTNQARTDPDFKATIAEVYRTLHGIVSGTGCRHFETSQSIPATGASSYTLSTDHLSSVRLAHVLSDGREEPVYELEAREEWKYKGLTGDARRFVIAGDQLTLYPKPSSGTYKLYYIPQPADYSSAADATEVDVVNGDGLAFLTWGVAIIIHGELEGNASLAMIERDKAADRLEWWAIQRSQNAPHARVVEPSNANDETWNPSGFWNRPQ